MPSVDLNEVNDQNIKLSVLQKILLDRLIPKWIIIILALIILFISGLLPFL